MNTAEPVGVEQIFARLLQLERLARQAENSETPPGRWLTTARACWAFAMRRC